MCGITADRVMALPGVWREGEKVYTWLVAQQLQVARHKHRGCRVVKWRHAADDYVLIARNLYLVDVI